MLNYNEIIELNPKLKAFDLALIYIYQNLKNKPFLIRKEGGINYYQDFWAIDNKSNKLLTVLATTKSDAEIMLRERIVKGTKRYEDWATSQFGISFEPLSNCKDKYILKKMKEDFPQIKDHKEYLLSVYEKFTSLTAERLTPKLRRYYK